MHKTFLVLTLVILLSLFAVFEWSLANNYERFNNISPALFYDGLYSESATILLTTKLPDKIFTPPTNFD